MMHTLQVQVWGCIIAHTGLSYQKKKRETSDIMIFAEIRQYDY